MTAATTPKPTESGDYRLTNLRVGPAALLQVGTIVLVTAITLTLFTDAWSRLAHSYLLGVVFSLSISLGALFFVMLQHLVGARWSVTVRRVAELLMSAIPWLGLMLSPVLGLLLLGDSTLYRWNDAELLKTDALIAHKAAYLNAPFFVFRIIVYFAAWTWLSQLFLRNSVEQDGCAGRATLKMRRWSGPGMLVFALTVNFAAFDLLMSLDPHWFSTIYGVYFFSGCVVAFIASVILAVAFLQSRGLLREEVTVEHYHDLGKMLFGFVFFWGYIAFSQYLLIWYANIPEETVWYAARQAHGWGIVSLVLLFGHLVLPFAGLMSRSLRRNPRVLIGWSFFLLAMHAVDLFYLVTPSTSPTSAMPTVVDALCLLAVTLIWLALTLQTMAKHRLLATGDPHLSDSIAFHNV